MVVCAALSGGFPSGSSPQNLKRVAEVWMDEYAEYIYQRRPEYRHLSAGDVAAQKELRNNLNCKSFKWFMNEVAWDLPKFYPPVEPPAAAWGEASWCSDVCSEQIGCGLVFKVAHVPQLLWVKRERVFKDLLDVSKPKTPLPLHWPDQSRQLGRQLLLLVYSSNENRDLACSACCVFSRKQNMPEGGLGRGSSWAVVKSCISKGLYNCADLLLSLALSCETQGNHPYFWKSAVFWE